MAILLDKKAIVKAPLLDLLDDDWDILMDAKELL